MVVHDLQIDCIAAVWEAKCVSSASLHLEHCCATRPMNPVLCSAAAHLSEVHEALHVVLVVNDENVGSTFRTDVSPKRTVSAAATASA